MFIPRYLHYVLFRITELCLSQDICIMYYSELENYVYPKIFALCIIKNYRIRFTPKIPVLCIIQYLRIMFIPRLVNPTIVN